jgi:hypothetical protein
MSLKRVLDAFVTAAGLAGGIYYVAKDNEIQGVVVVLLAILYFVAIPKITAPRS